MRVALLTDGVWPSSMGGMQKHSYYLAKYLAKKKIHVEVYYCVSSQVQKTISFEEVFSKDELAHLHFIKVDFPYKHYFPGHYIYESYLYSKAIYRKFNSNVDLIYIQGFSGWHLLKKNEKQNTSSPTILNFHGLEMFQVATDVKSKIINAFLRIFVSKNLEAADYVQSLGGKLTEILCDRGVDKGRIIEQGIGIDESWVGEQRKVSPNQTIRKFIFIGRYERRKGLDELFDVLKTFHSEGRNNFQVDFIGPIPENKRWKEQNIHYHGQVQESEIIKKQLFDADVLICPSYSEGMPTVILEAMASGCAVIATDVGAVREQVSNKNGWLIEVANKHALKKAMIEAIELNNNDLLCKQQTSIQLIKEKFLWKKTIEDMIELFDRIVSVKEVG